MGLRRMGCCVVFEGFGFRDSFYRHEFISDFLVREMTTCKPAFVFMPMSFIGRYMITQQHSII